MYTITLHAENKDEAAAVVATLAEAGHLPVVTNGGSLPVVEAKAEVVTPTPKPTDEAGPLRRMPRLAVHEKVHKRTLAIFQEMGRFAGDARVTVRAMAEHTGFEAHVVHDAMGRLANKGLVETKNSLGSKITERGLEWLRQKGVIENG